MRKKELQELLDQLKTDTPTIEYVDGYKKYRESCTFRCLKSGKLFQCEPRYLFLTKKCFCEDCRNDRAIVGHKICDEKRRKTKQQIQKDINKHNPDIVYLEGYINNKHKMKVKCINCGWEWWPSSSNIFKRHIDCPCCGDGISYPNKYFRSLLLQLDLNELEFEYTTNFFRPYYYDCYFLKNGIKYLIEIDGDFHYKESSFKSLNNNVINDQIKNNLAEENGYHLIRIPTPAQNYNDLPMIIISSELSQIFDLNVVNWDRCQVDACKNITKLVWQDYMDNPSLGPKELAKKYYISSSCVNHYLIMGEHLGLFYYHRKMHPVFLINDQNNKIFFKSISSCVTYLNNELKVAADHRLVNSQLVKQQKQYYKICNYKITLFTDFTFQYTRKEEVFNADISISK